MIMENILICLILIFSVLISVAFLTLLEQKLLSYIQFRKGPNKVGLIGILQPFCDAIKLFSKEFMVPVYSNYLIYYFSPIFSLMLSLVIWLSFPFLVKIYSFEMSVLYLLVCMSMGVYSLMVSGWSSNSSYSLLGSLRSIAQTVSYEVCMILIMMFYIFLILSFNLKSLYEYQKYMNFMYYNLMLSMVIFIMFLAETNRAPFDFAEGESELVSGFNTEYSSGGFALIFLSEYASILFLSMLFIFLFMLKSYLFIFLFMKIVFVSFMFIWVRGSFPRLRYDKLMYLTWKIYLSFSLNYLIMMISFKLILLVIISL